MNNLVFVNNERPLTSSRLVAEKFGKRHADTIRAIQNLECSKEFNQRNFALSKYKDPTGRKLPEYHITKDGFTFLVMGFTGKQAAKFKEDYIKAFNTMEQQLKEPKKLSMEEVLEIALKNEREKKKLEQRNKQLEPKATMYDKVMDNGEKIDVGQLAKIFNIPGIGRNKMFELLRDRGVLFGSRNEPYQRFIERGYFEVKFKTIERNNHSSFTVTKVLVTKKGLDYLASLLQVNAQPNHFNQISTN